MSLIVQWLVVSVYAAMAATTSAINNPSDQDQEVIKIMSGDQMRILHTAMDSDKDGSVTLPEGSLFVRELCLEPMQLKTAPIVKIMDTNNDSYLSLEEFKEDLNHMPTIDLDRKEDFVRHFASFDDDGDSLLSYPESLPLFTFMFSFQKLDNNKDGVLTFEEFTQIAAEKLDGAPAKEIEKSKAQAKEIFRDLDIDGDNRINAKEHFIYDSGIYGGLSAWNMFFELGDTDKDGGLSKEEIVLVRENPRFGGSAAYHHSKYWFEKIVEVWKATRKNSSEL